jgi:hypothetical protein
LAIIKNTNNYGLGGVASNVQLGKQGPRFVANTVTGGIDVRDVSNSTLLNLKVANGTNLSDAVNYSQLLSVVAGTANDGQHISMGNLNGNSSYQYTGAITLATTTTVSNAIESLNSILSHLVPTAPVNFPTGTFTITNTVGVSPLLAGNGVTDRSGGTSGYSAGNSVNRTSSTTITTSTLTLNNQSPNGLAADLTLTLKVNNAVSTSYTFTDITANGSTDNGNHSGIVISSQTAFPASTPGFWKSFSVQATGALSFQGINSLQITSNEEGNSNILYWVQDNNNTTPAATSTSMSLLSNGTLAYSSSVPHFGTGGTLTGGCSISNLAGETYYNGNPLTITGTNNVIVSQSYSYATLGITTPIPRQTLSALAVSPFTISMNGTNLFSQGILSANVYNVNGNSQAQLSSTVVLVKNGTYSAIDELNITVSNHGSLPNANSATRITVTGDGTGVDTPNSAAFTAWSSTATLPSYEAAVVAGALSCNQTNYASGYLPIGPNLSGRATTQYFTFAFQRSSVSTFTINITGTYAHCWIALPGVSDNSGISPNSINGVWWDTAVAYQGVGVPGDASNPNAGCAYNISNETTGTTGAFEMTLGTQSSSNSTGSNILVRLKLTTGQSITAITIT